MSLWLHCLQVINDCLDELIERAKSTKQEDDLEALQARDYSKVMQICLTLSLQVSKHTQLCSYTLALNSWSGADDAW